MLHLFYYIQQVSFTLFVNLFIYVSKEIGVKTLYTRELKHLKLAAY